MGLLGVVVESDLRDVELVRWLPGVLVGLGLSASPLLGVEVEGVVVLAGGPGVSGLKVLLQEVLDMRELGSRGSLVELVVFAQEEVFVDSTSSEIEGWSLDLVDRMRLHFLSNCSENLILIFCPSS